MAAAVNAALWSLQQKSLIADQREAHRCPLSFLSFIIAWRTIGMHIS
jgi:hypothetical protein